MAGLDERFIPLTLLNEFFVDQQTGLPLANGTLEFFRDTSRETAKTVYELTTTNGEYTYTALPNPVTLNSVGNAQNAAGTNVAVYAYPYITDPATGNLTLDLYFIRCKDSGGTIQWTRQAVPNLTTENDPANNTGTAGNQLSNPQFSRYFLINDSTDLTVSASNTVFPIAPDWDLVASGSGTISIQRFPVAGNSAIPTYPAFYLSITVGTGVTNPRLRQRLNKNSGLWSGTFLSGFIAAKVASGSNALTMKYQDSSGATSDVDIFDASLTTSWATYGGSVEIDDSSNTQSGDDAHVDIVLELPVSNTTDITSIQVLASDAELTGDIQNYDKRSANRDQALMGDWYIPRLEKKQVESLLIGWDFPKNPAQFGASGTVGANTAAYAWDQTILKTSTSASVDYSRSTPSKGLNLKHTVADQAYALIQYLDGSEANKFVGSRLSVNINGYTTDAASSADDTAVQVRMFANSGGSSFGTVPTVLVTVGADGEIALTATAVSAGWYEITRSNLPVAKGTLTPLAAGGDISTVSDISLNGWVIEDDTQVNNGVAGVCVVVSFVPAASSTNYNTIVDSISVTPGDIPSRPAPLPFDTILRALQRYYEKSYGFNTAVGTATANGAVVAQQLVFPLPDSTATTTYSLISRAWGVQFKAPKRTASYTFTVRSTNSGASGTIQPFIFNGGAAQTVSPTTISISDFTASGKGTEGIIYVPANVNNLTSTSGAITGNKPEAFIKFHYVADARLGVV